MPGSIVTINGSRSIAVAPRDGNDRVLRERRRLVARMRVRDHGQVIGTNFHHADGSRTPRRRLHRRDGAPPTVRPLVVAVILAAVLRPLMLSP